MTSVVVWTHEIYLGIASLECPGRVKDGNGQLGVVRNKQEICYI